MTATNHSFEQRTPPAARAPAGRAQGPRWSCEQIRAARMVPLVPLLRKRGLQLIELPAGNFELATCKGLLIEDSYWCWPPRDQAGNAIDFFVRVLGLSFNDAMRQLTGP